MLTLAAVLLLPFVVFAAPEISVKYGFENNAKSGRYLPLHVTYTSDEDFEGSISIFNRETDDNICEYRNEVKLTAGDDLSVTYYIPLGIRATSIHISLSDIKGNTIVSRDVKLGIDANNAHLFIGVLSDTPEALDYFDGLSVNYGLLRTQKFELTTEGFPGDSRGLDMLDVIVITNYRLRKLDEAQSHALMDWVRAGGVVLLGTGERVDDTLGRYAPELLDDMYEDPEMCEVELLNGPSAAEPSEGIAALYCADVAIRGGNVIQQDAGLPLLTSVSKEKGLIIISAYDFAETASFAGEHSVYAPDLLARCLGANRMSELAGEIYGDDNSEYTSISSLVFTGDMSRIPPIGIYALSIIAFILLAGPVLYLFLKQRELTGYYRIGVVLLSLCFSIVIFLMGSRTRFENTFYNFAAIVDADENSVAKTTFLNLRNPYNREYSVDISGDYTIYPVRDNYAVNRVAEDWSEPIDVSTVITRKETDTTVTIGEVGAFTPQYFSLEKTYENENGEGFTGYVTVFGNEVDGSISNNFDYDVRNAAVILYGKLIPLGNLNAGENVELKGKNVLNVPVIRSKEVAARYVEDEEEQNTVAFYHDLYMTGYSNEARIVGFIDNDEIKSDALIDNADLNGRGLVLVTSALSLDTRKDEQIYRPTLIRQPEVISGSYDYAHNSMSSTEPCILEYQLGTDLQLISVLIEWPETDDECTLSLYNYTTGSYDQVNKTKTVFEIEELGAYLSPAVTMTVRYYSPATEPTPLPIISVVGM